MGHKPKKSQRHVLTSALPAWLWPFAALLLFGILTMDTRLHINGDNVDYMRLAESIRGGDIWPASRLPPGFPWLLTPVQAIWGMDLLPQKILVLVLYALGAFLALRLAMSLWGSFRGAVAACLGMSLVPVLEYGHYVLSEIPYLAATLGALLLVDGGGEDSGRKGQLLGRAIWAGLLAGAAFWIRSIGIVVVMSVPLALLLRRQRKEALASLIAGGLLLLPWLARATLGEGGRSYFEQLLLVNPYYPEYGTLTAGDFLTRVLANAKEYFLLEVPHLVWPVQFRATYTEAAVLAGRLPVPAVAAALFLIGVGWVSEVRKRRSWILVLTLTLGVCVVWPPIWTSSRFLVPVVPFLMWCFLAGTERFGRLVLGQRGKWLLAAVAATVILLALVNGWKLRQQSRAYPQPWENYFRAARWVRDSTPEDVLVIDRKPGLFEFVSQRHCERFLRESDPSKLLDDFAARGVDLVVLSRIPFHDINMYLLPAIAENPDRFEVLYRQELPPRGETYVFRFLSTPRGELRP